MSELSPELQQIVNDGKLISQQIAAAEIDPTVKHLLGEILALHEGGIAAVGEELEEMGEAIEEIIDDSEEIVQEDRASIIMTGLAIGMAAIQKLKEAVANDPAAMTELVAAEQQILAAQQAVAEVTVPASDDVVEEESADGNG